MPSTLAYDQALLVCSWVHASCRRARRIKLVFYVLIFSVRDQFIVLLMHLWCICAFFLLYLLHGAKTLRVSSPNGDQTKVSVMDSTTVKEILQQCHEGETEERRATLVHGVTLLKPSMSMKEVGLGDGDELSLMKWKFIAIFQTIIWSQCSVDIARWTGEEMGSELYICEDPARNHKHRTKAFRHCKALAKLVIHGSVNRIGMDAFCGCESLTEVEIHGNPKLCDHHRTWHICWPHLADTSQN